MTSFGYVRVGAYAPVVHVGDPLRNGEELLKGAVALRDAGVQVGGFSELCLTGYECKDLFHQPWLHEKVGEILGAFVASMPRDILCVLSMPLLVDGQLFNCAVPCANGEILAYIPKTYLANNAEFEEARWFHPAPRLRRTEVGVIPIGTDILIEVFPLYGSMPFLVAVEQCEDLWSVTPMSSLHAAAGAVIVVNPSASPAGVGKHDYRVQLVGQQSARCILGYVYVGAGPTESTSALVYDRDLLVCENGELLAQSERFGFGEAMVVADIDVERLQRERMRIGSFGQGVALQQRGYRVVRAQVHGCDVTQRFERRVDPTPFVPTNLATREARCREVFDIQATGLARRLMVVPGPVTLGVSGGLDSTLALLETVRALGVLRRPLSDLHAFTLPGPGTTDRTHANACRLCDALGVELRNSVITPTATAILHAEGHEPCWNCTKCENAQARARTVILMTHGFVVGTGDLSEKALGWCTYGGDQLSMYDVNAGVPKTLVQFVVRMVAETRLFGGARAEDVASVLLDILDTPISPELRRPGADGAIVQKTEELVGPYLLNDFFLYHVLRHGTPPAKVAFLAKRAFAGRYDDETILRHLCRFFERFFAAQFKRNASADGPKVGTVCLNPRGDWRMPADINGAAWLREAKALMEHGAID